SPFRRVEPRCRRNIARMKPSHLIRSLFVVVTSCAVIALAVDSPAPTARPDPWQPLRGLLGKWIGDVSGEPGVGKAEREYAFTLNDRFIHVANKSIYPPQEKNKKGETHEDEGF